MYYRRTRRQDINLITGIRLLPEREEPYPIDGWRKADLSLRAGILRASPLYLWYRTGKTASEMTTEEKANIITELDVTFGDDIPWYGFEKIEPPTTSAEGKVQSVHISIRRGVKREPPCKLSLTFPTEKEGGYRITPCTTSALLQRRKI